MGHARMVTEHHLMDIHARKEGPIASENGLIHLLHANLRVQLLLCLLEDLFVSTKQGGLRQADTPGMRLTGNVPEQVSLAAPQ